MRVKKVMILSLSTMLLISGCSEAQLIEKTVNVVGKTEDGGKYYLIIKSIDGGDERMEIKKEDWEKVKKGEIKTFSVDNSGKFDLRD